MWKVDTPEPVSETTVFFDMFCLDVVSRYLAGEMEVGCSTEIEEKLDEVRFIETVDKLDGENVKLELFVSVVDEMDIVRFIEGVRIVVFAQVSLEVLRLPTRDTLTLDSIGVPEVLP